MNANFRPARDSASIHTQCTITKGVRKKAASLSAQLTVNSAHRIRKLAQVASQARFIKNHIWIRYLSHIITIYSPR